MMPFIPFINLCIDREFFETETTWKKRGIKMEKYISADVLPDKISYLTIIEPLFLTTEYYFWTILLHW